LITAWDFWFQARAFLIPNTLGMKTLKFLLEIGCESTWKFLITNFYKHAWLAQSPKLVLGIKNPMLEIKKALCSRIWITNSRKKQENLDHPNEIYPELMEHALRRGVR
jgi:hypothetical protein